MEIGLLVKSWQVGLTLGLHCSPVHLCLVSETNLQHKLNSRGQGEVKVNELWLVNYSHIV